MDQQDSSYVPFTQQDSYDSSSTHFTPNFAPENIPFHTNYQFSPMSASYQSGPHISFQDLLATPKIPNANAKLKLGGDEPKTNKKNANQTTNLQIMPGNRKWTTTEDVALTRAYLYVSVDADVGNNQRVAAMWNRIYQAWKENMGTQFSNARNINSLQCRWADLNFAVKKFNSIYGRLERLYQSGTNAQNMMKAAIDMYKELHKKDFKFEQCWEILKKNPKWCTMQDQNQKKKGTSKLDALPLDEPIYDVGDDSVTENNGCDALNLDEIPRPEGRKACKDKKRKATDQKSVVDVLSKLQCTLEMQIVVDREELELKKEKELKEFQLREQILKKEIELKESAQKLKMKDQDMKEEAQRLKRKDQELRERAQKRQEQERVMSQDLNKLSPDMQKSFEVYRAQILKEWENEGMFGKKN